MPERGPASAFKKFFIVFRAYSWPASLVPVVIGAVAAARDAAISWPAFALTFAAALLVHSAANLANTYFDWRNGVDRAETADDRGILDGLIGGRAAPYVAVSLFAAAGLIGLWLAWSRSVPELIVLGAAGFALAWFYTADGAAYKYRALGEMNIAGQQRGFARIGADFWPVVKNERGRIVGTLAARYPETAWRNLDIRSCVLEPGADGAIATQRFEMMREGIQECEARIFIERALLDEALRAKLGEALATKCQRILDERTVDTLRALNAFTFHPHFTGNAADRHMYWHNPAVLGAHWFITSDWQTRTEALYEAAADTARQLGKP